MAYPPGERAVNKLQDMGFALDCNPKILMRVIDDETGVSDLLAALKAALPTLTLRATEEARSNKAPTGLKPSTTHRDILAAAQEAIRKAEGR